MKTVDVVSSALGVICLVLAHYFPDLAAAMYAAGGGLLAGGLPQLSSLIRRVPPAAILVFVVGLSTSACSGTAVAKERAFWTALAECTSENDEAAGVKRAALACVVGVVGGDYLACLASVEPALSWTTDEIVCVARATKGRL